jgi:nucleoside-diphosphate-sugar epimerase
MINLLLTGGSGFIGTNIIHYYSSLNFNILNIDINKPLDSNHVKFWKNIDILNYNNLSDEILNFKPNYVIHLAARTDLYGKNLQDYEVNFQGTKNLLSALNNISSVTRVIFTSSMLVCKRNNYSTNPFQYSPTTVYGNSKAKMEDLIFKSIHSYIWTIVRPTSIWGPWFSEPYYNFFKLINNNKYYHIKGLKTIKTFGYVENIIYQYDSILNASFDKIDKQIFYLGDYQNYDLKTWADEIALFFNIKLKSTPFWFIKIISLIGDILIFFGFNFPISSFRLNNIINDNIINLEKTKEIAPTLPFSRIQGINKTVNWYKQDLINEI